MLVKRVRQALSHDDRAQAKQKADALALAFRRNERAPQVALTLGALFDIYVAEVTPAKGVSKREHDARVLTTTAKELHDFNLDAVAHWLDADERISLLPALAEVVLPRPNFPIPLA